MECYFNQITNLNLTQNIALTNLQCAQNSLTSLDVSNNTALTQLGCEVNQLTSLDLRNGNNQNLLNFNVTSNPNLTCINVDDVTYSTNIDVSQCNNTNSIIFTNQNLSWIISF